MKQLEGKVAIITGATRGIGKGIAEIFAKEGAKIAFTYAGSVDKAKALEEEFKIRNINYKSEFRIPVFYKDSELDCDFKCDFLIENLIVLELKSTINIIGFCVS